MKTGAGMWLLRGRDTILFAVAVMWLGVARFSIVCFSFRRIARIASRPLKFSMCAEPERGVAIKRVRWAIAAAAKRVPWRAMCFEQGLASHIMLRRRGISSVLYYGASPDDKKGLAAHVWVRVGQIDVTGCEVAEQFAVLAVFPPNISSRNSPVPRSCTP